MSANSVPASVAVDCPAKINLHLRVGPVRADGFHPLMSWMATVGLFDRLTLHAEATGVAAPIRLTCDPASLPSDDRNLVVRMIHAWAVEREAAAHALPGITALLQKQIPAGAGLGGGSSNAAGALLAAEVLLMGGHMRPLSQEALMSLAAKVGSDIAFFLHAPSAICSGRGEVVRPIEPPEARWAILLLPPIHMPTPDVYGQFDAMKLGRTEDVERQPNWEAWSKLPAVQLMDELVNDLEAPAFALRPELNEIRIRAGRTANRVFRMSGSGSSLFTLFGDERIATEVADYLRIRLNPLGIKPDAVKVVKVGVPVDVRRSISSSS